MNIQQAKEQIRNAILAYRQKDAYGRLVIPQQRQRPVFLLGAPGIGKTAIMEQIAQELGIPLVSYSMTHHTRQSALGLPFIREREFEGTTYRVSEYTMSEIIAAVYDKMEQTGTQEGILFLDEINCVSETLAPAMLQFLQYKVFGQHKVPEGWIVATAGNPPEYNNSVREFDMVTWDRLKRIDVEPEYDTWRTWAVDVGVHPAVTTYMDIRKGDFYHVESTVDGKAFVTPRGWVDLSDMLRLYEQLKLTVDEKLVGQYLQHGPTAKQFAIYYDLWLKYRSDYQVDAILEGKAPAAILDRAKAAKFDERISLIGLLTDAILHRVRDIAIRHAVTADLQRELLAIRRQSAAGKMSLAETLVNTIQEAQKKLATAIAGRMLSRGDEEKQRLLIAFLQEQHSVMTVSADKAADFTLLKAAFDKRVKGLKKDAAAVGKNLENLFAFAENAFGEGQEMLILVTELTAARDAAWFISQYGCDAYFRHNKELLFYVRQVQVIQKLEALGLEEE